MAESVTERFIVGSYRRELLVLGYSESTVFNKIRSVLNFKTYLGKSYFLIDEKDLSNYVFYLSNKKGLHSSTIHHYYQSIEQFYLYLERSKLVVRNPFNYYRLELVNQKKQTRSILSQEEVLAVYEVVKTDGERMLLHLSYGCGLRAMELERLNVEDVLLGSKLLEVVSGKNNQHRLVPISDGMLLDFTTYLENREKELVKTRSLLLNSKGNRLRSYTARIILQSILKRTSIKKVITLHSLRHSIATHLLANGMLSEQVQHFLGHKQLETTELYMRVNAEQLKSLE